PTGIAFQGNGKRFNVFVIESGKGLPSGFNEATDCNSNNKATVGGPTSSTNPFPPDLVVFDENGRKGAGPLGKFSGPGSKSFQKDGPAIGLAFENGFSGGSLFGTDSNQGVRGAASGGGNNTSRVVTIDLARNLSSASVNSFISGLPTGDHPTELIIVKDGFIYWSQGSATNSGVTGHDNGGGGNQHDIACQDITLSQNVFDSGDGHFTSGYSNHAAQRKGAHVKAFEDATAKGMCTGAILRAKIDTRKAARATTSATRPRQARETPPRSRPASRSCRARTARSGTSSSSLRSRRSHRSPSSRPTSRPSGPTSLPTRSQARWSARAPRSSPARVISASPREMAS